MAERIDQSLQNIWSRERWMQYITSIMKPKPIFFLYPVAVILMSLFVIVSCSEDTEPEITTVTDIDGNVYQTVTIGFYEWTVENLRVSRYNNGDPIPTGLNNTGWENTTDGAYAIYPHGNIDGIDSPEKMIAAYGKLYNWYAVDDPRGLCPEGWSVPGDDHWTEMYDYVVDQGYPHSHSAINGAGNALKSCRQIDSPLGDDCDTSEHPRWDEDTWSNYNHHGFDEFGFSALPGGYRWTDGGFGRLGAGGYWWSSTESVPAAWGRAMDRNFGGVFRYGYSKSFGFSLRCVRDAN